MRQRMYRLAITVWLVVMAVLATAQMGAMRGTLYDDMNGNGVRDFTDVGLANVQFDLVGPLGYQTIVSDFQGNFHARDLLAGSYTAIPRLYGHGTVLSPTPIGTFPFNIGPGDTHNLDIGFHQTCVTFDRDALRVTWDFANGAPNGIATVRIPFHNDNDYPIGWVFVTPVSPNGMSVVSLQPIAPIPSVVPAGGDGVVVFKVNGLPQGERACFSLAFHEPNLERCCEEPICFDVPLCECFQDIEHRIECIDGQFRYSFTIQSLYDGPVNQVWVYGPGAERPDVIFQNLSLGQYFTYNGIITNPSLGGQIQCFRIMFYAGGTRCCFKDLCFRFPFCDRCDDRPAYCYATRPNYSFRDPANRSYNRAAWNQLNGQTVAAVTCWAEDSIPGMAFRGAPVFGFMNLARYQSNPPTAAANYGPDWASTGDTNAPSPRGFHNGIAGDLADVLPTPPECQWTKKYMGSVFPITFDDEGNTYVAQTSCYNSDYAPLISDFNISGVLGRNHTASTNEVASGRLHGRIFKIHNITGKVTIFNEDVGSTWNGVPSGPDPLITNNGASAGGNAQLADHDERYPEIGDITFDYDNRQIFATCMDDGHIYRFDMNGNKLPGSLDPWAADNSGFGNGFAGIGEVVWACKYHRGRLYFSRWIEDFDNVNTAVGAENEIWSIAINPSNGTFSGTPRLEVTMPPLAAVTGGYPLSGNPPFCTPLVSDITFTSLSNDTVGTMVVAERGMGGFWQTGWAGSGGVTHSSGAHKAFTNTYPHRARGLEFECDPTTGRWVVAGSVSPNNTLKHRLSSNDTSGSGALDFDFDTRGTTGAGNLGNRHWFMVDYVNWPLTNATDLYYGLQGVKLTGGWQNDSIVIDLDGAGGGNGYLAKNTNGDVEIPCPAPSLRGTTKWCDYPPGMALPVNYDVRTPAGVVVYSVTFTPGADGTFQIALPPDLAAGSYVLRAKSSHWLRKSVAFDWNGAGPGEMMIELYNGDIVSDNEVNIGDYAALSSAYNTEPGDAGWLAVADLNGDESIDIGDYAILSSNYGRVGDD